MTVNKLKKRYIQKLLLHLVMKAVLNNWHVTKDLLSLATKIIPKILDSSNNSKYY